MTYSPAPQRRRGKDAKSRILSKKVKPVIAYAAPDRLIMCSQSDADCGRTQLYLLLPCASTKSARKRLAFERLTFDEKVEAVAKCMYDCHRHPKTRAPQPYTYLQFDKIEAWERDLYRERASAILHLLGEGEERK